jgi:hypothetical protein
MENSQFIIHNSQFIIKVMSYLDTLLKGVEVEYNSPKN